MGQAADLNDALNPSSFEVAQTDLPKSFTAFNLDTAGPNHTITMSVTGSAPSIQFAPEVTATIAGALRFSDAGSQGAVNFGSMAPNITGNHGLNNR